MSGVMVGKVKGGIQVFRHHEWASMALDTPATACNPFLIRTLNFDD